MRNRWRDAGQSDGQVLKATATFCGLFGEFKPRCFSRLVDCISPPRKPLLEATVPQRTAYRRTPRHPEARLRRSNRPMNPSTVASRSEVTGLRKSKDQRGRRALFHFGSRGPAHHTARRPNSRLSRRLNSCSPDIGDKGPAVALQAFDGLKTRPGNSLDFKRRSHVDPWRVRAKSEYIMPRPWSHFLRP